MVIMPTLILMRHGEAQSFAASDKQRPLTSTGQAQVAQQALKQGIPWHDLQRVLVSPYLRTQQTYLHWQLTIEQSTAERSTTEQSTTEQSTTEQAAHKSTDTNNWPLETSPLITPHGQPELVQAWLLQQPLVNTLLITHQPLISQLIGFFDKGDQWAGPSMFPASVAVLEGEVWARGCLPIQGVFHV